MTGKRWAAQAAFDALVLLETDDHVWWPHAKTSGGYGLVGVSNTAVHVAALESRIPKPFPEAQACHQPGIGCGKLCMNYRHLRWGTAADNKADAMFEGVVPRGEKHALAKLTEQDVLEIRRLRAEGALHRDLAAQLGVNKSNISHIMSGRSWRWL